MNNKNRIVWVVAVFLAIAVVCKVGFDKIVKGPSANKELTKRFRTDTIEGSRGNILAFDGRTIACSVNEYEIYMDPCAEGLKNDTFKTHINTLATQLAGFFHDRSADEYKRLISSARTNGKHYIRISPKNVKLNYEQYTKLKKFAIFKYGRNKGGLIVQTSGARKRPYGYLAGRTLGKPTRRTDRIIGIEQAYDKELKGKKGLGQRTRIGNEWIILEAESPEEGLDVRTTINIDIQEVAENSLLESLRRFNADHGVAMLMEVKTGAIRAIVNLKRTKDGNFTEDYHNFAIADRIEPGSTFKLATAMALLEDQYITPADTINIFGGRYRIADRTMTDSHTDGPEIITIKEGFAASSNVCFARLALKYYEKDPNRFIDHLHSFGLEDDLGVEVDHFLPGKIKKTTSNTWSYTTLPWMSIGYEVALSPIQLLTFYNAVAGGGVMMKPMFVSALEREGNAVKVFKPEVMRRKIAQLSTIRAVHELLKEVVQNGTAKNLKQAHYNIAGKTGTAHIWDNEQKRYSDSKYLASFAGFFPAENPLYTCVVMVWEPKGLNHYGNVVAGSVFRDIADRVIAQEAKKGNIRSTTEIKLAETMPYSKGGKHNEVVRLMKQLNLDYDDKNVNQPWVSCKAGEDQINLSSRNFMGDVVPNVKGMGARDAVMLMEQCGLKVQLIGNYGKVTHQSIPNGSNIQRGNVVTLTLN